MKTPGQICYETLIAALNLKLPDWPRSNPEWDRLGVEQECWETAAKAVTGKVSE